MSVMQIDTTNRAGQRPASSYKDSNIVAVFRAPAETPPVPGYFTTSRLSRASQPAASQASTPAAAVDTATAPTPRTITKKAALRHALGAAVLNPLMPPRFSPVISHQPGTIFTLPSQQPASPTPTTAGNTPSPTPIVPAPGSNIAPVQPPYYPYTAPVSSQSSPTPVTQPAMPAPSSVALVSGGAAAQTAQAGTPVPVGWPTNQSYTDSSGNVWGFTQTAGWTIIGTASAANASGSTAGTSTPTTTITVGSSNTTVSDLTSWLQSETIVGGVKNFWVAAAAGALGLMLWGSMSKRR